MGRIVVLGSLNADLVVRVPVLPTPGQTVLGDRLQTFGGGKGANQAVAAARLGGEVSMVGRVGSDTYGRMLLDQLRADGVDVAAVVTDPEEPTGVALIMVDPAGRNEIAVASGANAAVGAAETARAMDLLDAHALLVLQLEIPLPVVRTAIGQARGRGARVILNAAPASGDRALLKGLDVLVVNESEAASMFGVSVGSLDGAHDAARAASHAGVGLAIVTLGVQGAVYSDGPEAHHIETFDVEAVDTTAAGDAFVGALAVALDRRWPVESAVRFANAAGAAAASSLGAQASLPRTADLRRLFGVTLLATRSIDLRD